MEQKNKPPKNTRLASSHEIKWQSEKVGLQLRFKKAEIRSDVGGSDSERATSPSSTPGTWELPPELAAGPQGLAKGYTYG